MHPLDLAGLAFYFLLLILIGYLSSRQIHSSDDFAVAR